jgi:hypothetical protein
METPLHLIYPNKRRLVFVTILLAVYVPVGLFYLLPLTVGGFVSSITIFLLVMTPFAALGAIAGATKIFRNRPALIIAREGIVITGFSKDIKINWRNIESISARGKVRQINAQIHVNNPEEISANYGLLIRFNVRYNFNSYGCHFVIPLVSYDPPQEAVLQLLFDEFENYKRLNGVHDFVE